MEIVQHEMCEIRTNNHRARRKAVSKCVKIIKKSCRWLGVVMRNKENMAAKTENGRGRAKPRTKMMCPGRYWPTLVNVRSNGRSARSSPAACMPPRGRIWSMYTPVCVMVAVEETGEM